MLNMARALGATGHEAAVVTSRVPGLPDVDSSESFGTVYRIYDRSEAGSQKVIDRVLSAARELHSDVIEGADHLGDCAGLLRVPRRPPVLIKFHSCNILNVLKNSNVYYPWQKLTIAAAILRNCRMHARERFCIENADFACAPSRRILEEIRKQGLRLPVNVEVIPNPMIPPAPAQGGEADRPIVLFVGRIEIGKGIQYLPGMMHSLVREFPDVVLEIAGEDTYARGIGSLRTWLERQFGSAPGNVRFLGRLSRADLDQAYRRAWVVALPSRWDNFPTVVLEAMGFAKAVVGSPHGGMQEMMEGTRGAIADPASPGFALRVGDLLRDKVLREEVGKSLRLKLEQAYSPGVVVGRYVKFLEASL
jgi:glycosyltransferase involved in cell wall biosynthesis